MHHTTKAQKKSSVIAKHCSYSMMDFGAVLQIVFFSGSNTVHDLLQSLYLLACFKIAGNQVQYFLYKSFFKIN